MRAARAAAAGALVVVLEGCTDPPTAQRALENLGMTNIEAGGFAWFMCGEHDHFATRFRARNQNGLPVSGAVCSGWFKGATVRFD